MEFGNIGGIALILAGLVWLAVFVPSWARRSELRALEENAKSYALSARGALSREEKLTRTRSIFAAGAALGILGGAGLILLGAAFWLSGLMMAAAVLATLVSVSANRSLNQRLATNYEARQRSREQVSRKLEQSAVASGWTPNPLPQPLNAPKRGELIAPSADVIPLRAATQDSVKPLNSTEIAEILKRRRAI